MKSTKVTVLRKNGAGYMLMRYPKSKKQFQFCSPRWWRTLGGPSHVEVGDTYVLRESERGYPSVNWQTPLKITGTFVLLAETAQGYSVRLREEESGRVIGLNGGHIIRSTDHPISESPDQWDLEKDDSISLYVTPYGLKRAFEDDARRSSSNKKNDNDKPLEETGLMASFIN